MNTSGRCSGSLKPAPHPTDENSAHQDIPIGIRRILSAHDVRSAFQMGWARLNNSNLLDAAEQAGFEALITADPEHGFQQNLAGWNIAVVVLSTNFWPTILT